MDSISKLLAKNIKAARNSKNWTQHDLAVKSGVSYRSIQNIETCVRTPRPKNIQAIAGALGVSLESLYIDPGSNQELTPQTLKALQDATKATIKEAFKEAKTPQINLEYQSKREELASLVRSLPDSEVAGLITYVKIRLTQSPMNKRKISNK
jgi:transcriptional regulator with XRE-family HTH domain